MVFLYLLQLGLLQRQMRSKDLQSYENKYCHLHMHAAVPSLRKHYPVQNTELCMLYGTQVIFKHLSFPKAHSKLTKVFKSLPISF